MALTRASAGVIKTEELIGYKNRIINGDIRIDQRNNGAVSNIAAPLGVWGPDRWLLAGLGSNKYTIQQKDSANTSASNYESGSAPDGFTYSIKVTGNTTVAHTATTTDYFYMRQGIEGYNVADLNWGTASAKDVTLSFWVKSSVTGTFGGCISQGDFNSNYPFTYTISQANTWEKKIINIPGPKTTYGNAPWYKNNNAGLYVLLQFQGGSNYTDTPGTWNNAFKFLASGCVRFLTDYLGATWYMTGIQLEAGTTATNFENRAYTTELALCQRYVVAYRATDGTGDYSRYGATSASSSTNIQAFLPLPVPMRITPSVTSSANVAEFASFMAGNTLVLNSAITVDGQSTNKLLNLSTTIASGATAGWGGQLMSNFNKNSYLIFSAEL